MRDQAAALSSDQRRAVVEFLVGKPDGRPVTLARCDAGPGWFDFTQPPVATGWGQRLDNSRYIDAQTAGLTASSLGEFLDHFSEERAARYHDQILQELGRRSSPD